MQCNESAAKSFLKGGRDGSQDYRDCCDGGFGGGGASSIYVPGEGGGYSGRSVNGSFADTVNPRISARGPYFKFRRRRGALNRGGGGACLFFSKS